MQTWTCRQAEMDIQRCRHAGIWTWTRLCSHGGHADIHMAGHAWRCLHQVINVFSWMTYNKGALTPKSCDNRQLKTGEVIIDMIDPKNQVFFGFLGIMHLTWEAVSNGICQILSHLALRVATSDPLLLSHLARIKYYILLSL